MGVRDAMWLGTLRRRLSVPCGNVHLSQHKPQWRPRWPVSRQEMSECGLCLWAVGW